MILEEIELNLKAILEDLPRAIESIDNFLRRKGIEKETILKLQLAMDEAITNIIEYGCQDKAGVIKIVCNLSAKEITLIIEDNAKPFNPLTVKEPELSSDVEKRKIGGLGVFIMKKMMDEVSYEFRNGKNILTLKKKIPE